MVFIYIYFIGLKVIEKIFLKISILVLALYRVCGIVYVGEQKKYPRSYIISYRYTAIKIWRTVGQIDIVIYERNINNDYE